MTILLYVIAPGAVDPLLKVVSIIGTAAGAGAAGALNMRYDADIDAVMTRTAGRPIPDGRVSRAEALGFGLTLACGAVGVLALALNVTAAALLAFAIFLYIVVYTIWLKRRTPQNIVIGGAAGALPPVIGWTAATGAIGIEPLILFVIIFLWTPPHFFGRCCSLARTIMRVRACQCCPLLAEAPRRREKSLPTACFWSRRPCSRAFLGLPGRSMVRPPLSAERSSSRSLFG
jgi:protoheme IX farnesyltransferase